MKTRIEKFWRAHNVDHQRVWILSVGVAVALLLALRPAYTAQDGMVGVYSGLLSQGTRGQATVIARPKLVEILEEASDGVTKEITVEAIPENEPVTYHVQPRGSFQVGDQDCRTFSIRAAAVTEISETYRIACKGQDGEWRIATSPSRENDG